MKFVIASVNDSLSFREKVNFCLWNIPVGTAVCGAGIRQILLNDFKNIKINALFNSSGDFYLDYDVNSLYGKVVLGEDGNKTIEVLGTMLELSSSTDNKDSVIKRIFDKKANCYLNDKNSNWVNRFEIYEDLIASGFSAQEPKNWSMNSCKSDAEIIRHVTAAPNKESNRSVQSIFENHQKSLESKQTSDKPNNFKNINELFDSFFEKQKKEESFADRLKRNMEEGAYQGAADVAVKNAIDLGIVALKASGVDPDMANKLSEFMKTPIGYGLISMAIGSGVMFIPGEYAKNPHVAKLADKCQQNGSAAGVSAVISFAVNFLKPAIDSAISNSEQLKLVESFHSKVEDDEDAFEAIENESACQMLNN